MSQHRTVTGPSHAPRGALAAASLRALAALALSLALLPPSSAIAITRDVVLARGKVWVDANVPYSMERYATESGERASYSTGYRTDCSGFVSMCWQLTWDDGRPRSLATDTLDTVSERIGKADLLPGDILLKQKTPTVGGHAVLFVAWLDPLTKTEYVTYEERGSAYGTVSIIRDYPENGQDGYYPYRYLGIEEDYLDQIEPVRGYDRYETAVKASRSTFATGTVETVVVASGMDWPDALGGAALAGAWDAPVLLVRPDAVPSAVAREIRRLGATKAYLLGGEPAVSAAAEEALLRVKADFVVERIGGRDRYETAALAAAEALEVARARGKALGGTTFVASGMAFPDALAASPASAAGVRPILLSRPDRLPAATERALRSVESTHAVLLGGEPALARAVLSEVRSVVPRTERVSGEDRYETAAEVAAWSAGRGLTWRGAGLATGTTFPDALSGGVALGERGSVLLLTRGDRLAGATGTALRLHATEVGRAVCFGGMAAVSADVRLAVATLLGYVE